MEGFDLLVALVTVHHMVHKDFSCNKNMQQPWHLDENASDLSPLRPRPSQTICIPDETVSAPNPGPVQHCAHIYKHANPDCQTHVNLLLLLCFCKLTALPEFCKGDKNKAEKMIVTRNQSDCGGPVRPACLCMCTPTCSKGRTAPLKSSWWLRPFPLHGF